MKIRATEWTIEHGAHPAIWIKSKHCFYKLLDSHPEYANYYTLTKRKAALLEEILSIVDTDNGVRDYKGVVEKLQKANAEFTEEYLLQNKQFLLEQLGVVDSVSGSDFIDQLRSKSAKMPTPELPIGISFFISLC